jgi:hypothetical protein
LGLFSLVALLSARLHPRTRLTIAAAARYRKPHPTIADTLAAVHREIWAAQGFSMFRARLDMRKCRFESAKGSSTPFAKPREGR